MNEALERAKKLLADNRDKLDGLTELLIDRETIDRAQFAAFMRGEALPEKADEKTEKAAEALIAAPETTAEAGVQADENKES